jgi:ATP-dependent Clp protease ATP-binding subunit ClpC
MSKKNGIVGLGVLFSKETGCLLQKAQQIADFYGYTTPYKSTIYPEHIFLSILLYEEDLLREIMSNQCTAIPKKKDGKGLKIKVAVKKLRPYFRNSNKLFLSKFRIKKDYTKRIRSVDINKQTSINLKNLVLSPEALDFIRFAELEARTLKSTRICPHHILLALTSDSFTPSQNYHLKNSKLIKTIPSRKKWWRTKRLLETVRKVYSLVQKKSRFDLLQKGNVKKDNVSRIIIRLFQKFKPINNYIAMCAFIHLFRSYGVLSREMLLFLGGQVMFRQTSRTLVNISELAPFIIKQKLVSFKKRSRKKTPGVVKNPLQRLSEFYRLGNIVHLSHLHGKRSPQMILFLRNQFIWQTILLVIIKLKLILKRNEKKILKTEDRAPYICRSIFNSNNIRKLYNLYKNRRIRKIINRGLQAYRTSRILKGLYLLGTRGPANPEVHQYAAEQLAWLVAGRVLSMVVGGLDDIDPEKIIVSVKKTIKVALMLLKNVMKTVTGTKVVMLATQSNSWDPIINFFIFTLIMQNKKTSQWRTTRKFRLQLLRLKRLRSTKIITRIRKASLTNTKDLLNKLVVENDTWIKESESWINEYELWNNEDIAKAIPTENLDVNSVSTSNDQTSKKYYIEEIFDCLGIKAVKLRQSILKKLVVSPGNVKLGLKKDKVSILKKYAVDLTQKALDGQLDPVIGRTTEINRITEILCRRRKSNPILLGDPGVGKTAVVEGLAQLITDGNVPPALKNKRIMSLDLSRLVAGAKFRGQFESRLENIIQEVRESKSIILMIDEIHALVGAGSADGSAMDAANILKPALARGEFQCIGATTNDEYKQRIEKDPALVRRFQPVGLAEPSVIDAIEIIQRICPVYEDYHGVAFSDDAVKAAVEYADKYIKDRFLPDKAIDLIDEAGAMCRLKSYTFSSPEIISLKKELDIVEKSLRQSIRDQNFEEAIQLKTSILFIQSKINRYVNDLGIPQPFTVTEQNIAEVIATSTGIPVSKLTENESEKLLKIEEVLHSRVIGQSKAVESISCAVRRSRVGLKDPTRPDASFMFCGPTGVGKSELAKALAEHYYGSEEAMIRIDMSEYMEKHTVAKLIGAPPGYVGYEEGGQLTEAVRAKPYSLILLDEVEKAHPDTFNILLQVLEDGRLTDAQGRLVDFKNTLLIMTSNVGASAIEAANARREFDYLDGETDSFYNHVSALVQDELKLSFKPEFINRLDEVIVFSPLTKDEVSQIAKLYIKNVSDRLFNEGFNLETTKRWRDFLLEEGYNPSMGARPLRRAITNHLENPVSEAILLRIVKPGETIVVDRANGKVQVSPKNSFNLDSSEELF